MKPSPEFKPKEDGVDVETQIEDYELFDYRLEVKSSFEFESIINLPIKLIRLSQSFKFLLERQLIKLVWS